MNRIKILLLAFSVAAVGCGSGDAKPDPAKDNALKASFHAKPDINTLSPEMRKMVEGMMDASKKGKPVSAVNPPATSK